MPGCWRTSVLIATSLVSSACFGTYVPPQDTEATTTIADPSTTASAQTSVGPDSSTSRTAGSSTSNSGTTGPGSCEHVDFLILFDTGMDEAYKTLLMDTIVSNATNLATWLGDLDSIHFGLTTTASVMGNADEDCRGPGSLLQPLPLPNCPEQPFLDSVDDISNLAQCFGPALVLSGPPDEVSTPIQSLMNALGPFLTGPEGCNEGFHAPGDPIVIVVFTDSDDSSTLGLSGAAISILAQEGIPPSSMALVVIAGPVDTCDGEGGDGGVLMTCGADELPIEAPCRLDGFSRFLLNDQELPDHVRYWNICEAQEDDSIFLDALEDGFTQLVPRVCTD